MKVKRLKTYLILLKIFLK